MGGMTCKTETGFKKQKREIPPFILLIFDSFLSTITPEKEFIRAGRLFNIQENLRRPPFVAGAG